MCGVCERERDHVEGSVGERSGPLLDLVLTSPFLSYLFLGDKMLLFPDDSPVKASVCLSPKPDKVH